MVLSEAIRDYQEYARHELGCSPNTYRNYAALQRQFLRWLQEQGHPDPPVREISASLIRRYSYSLSGRDLRPRSVRGALHALRALFTFLKDVNLVDTNPARDVRLPKKDAATRLLVTDDDLMKLLEAAGRQRAEFRSVRDSAALGVLIFCGLRRRELLDLEVQHLSLDDRSLLVQQGKGGTSRTIPLCDEVLGLLREWLAVREQRKPRHVYLFVNVDGRRLGENGLHSLLQDVKAIAGFKDDPRIKPHSIRHAAATRLLRNGADLRSIQVWLGHAQLQTTAIYLHTDEQQVRKLANLSGFNAPASPSTTAAAAPMPLRRREEPAVPRRLRRQPGERRG